MDQTSHQNKDFDYRLLETEELYRQRKPDVARERVREIIASGYRPEGHELGLLKYLVAADLFYSNNYKKSIKIALESIKLLASSAYHARIGRVHLLLYRNHFAIGELKVAERYVYDALAFFRQADDSTGMIGALNGLGKLAFYRCDFNKSVDCINEAIALSKGDNVRMAQLIGNLGRIEILSGNWSSAEEHLKTALKLSSELEQGRSVARNHLSLGYLYLKQRKFSNSAHEFNAASIVIERDNLQWEKADLLEYEGDLAIEQGDVVKAKKILSEARVLAKELAPESTLCSQIKRRLAEAEFLLENLDESQRLVNSALDLAQKLGETAEIGFSKILIAQIFAARGSKDSAAEYFQDGIELLRNAGDPYFLARALLVHADFLESINAKHKVDKSYEEAFRLFNKLKMFYWAAESRFRHSVYCCKNSRISEGFKKLLESEYIFERVGEKSKIRAVKLYKQELSRQAVAVAISNENEFKIFGDYFSDSEYSNLKSGQLEEIINILGSRTNADRVLIYKDDKNGRNAVGQLSLTQIQKKKFLQQFEDLLGEEFAADKPTLILDSRRDPFINDLLRGKNNEVISSVIVVPLSLGKEVSGYIYLDRLSSNGNFRPFGQKDLNFAVGFADLIALKLIEYDKLLLEEDNKRLKAQLLEEAAFPNIITKNKQMLEMLARVQQIVNSNISISIQGETGCGKDLLAKTIHYNSDRREKRFISVNCAALPETLLESELFGHKKGAFTGADRDKVGLFEEADGGTFFLDEIADMPLSIQAKVLRILEEKEIVRLGDTRPVKVDVRIISATNRDLKMEMESGNFRQDLYYRLTALCFKIPSLRERREDIPLLIDHFAGDSIVFTSEAIKYLLSFDWPGNVRELENEIKKLVLLAGENSVVDVNLLSGKITDSVDIVDSDELRLNTDIRFSAEFSLYDYLAEYEKRFILKALREQNGVKKHAARLLNIPESTLRLKIRQYNINPNDFSPVK